MNLGLTFLKDYVQARQMFHLPHFHLLHPTDRLCKVGTEDLGIRYEVIMYSKEALVWEIASSKPSSNGHKMIICLPERTCLGDCLTALSKQDIKMQQII